METKNPMSKKRLPVNRRLAYSCTTPDSTSVCKDSATGYLKMIHEVYSHRISSIENSTKMCENQKYKQKILALESYVKHLYEQNDCFATTIENLERECDQRVAEMEKRLKKSAKQTMETVINIHEIEKETKRLLDERLYIESLYKDVKQHATSLKVENGFLRDQNSGLNHDIQALLQVIQNARSTGNWELDCVTFCEVTPEQVFGPIQSISYNYATDDSLQFFNRDSRKEKSHSSSHHQSSYLPKCASLPEIGNIYNFCLTAHKSNSCDATKGHLRVKLFEHKRSNAENTLHTPDMLKEVSCIKNFEERLCNRKSQSEPHLFMFDGNIYKYTPCEPIIKPSNSALNENYDSSLPAYQSIDLKFPTEAAKVTDCYKDLSSQENGFLKASFSSLDTCSTYSESDIAGLNLNMQRLLQESTNGHGADIPKFSIGLQAEIDRTTVGIQAIPYEFDECDSIEELLQSKKESGSITDCSDIIDCTIRLKEDLNKALIHTEQKSVLVNELQNHLKKAYNEVEAKNKVIITMESRLELSHEECHRLKKDFETLTEQTQLLCIQKKKSTEEIESLNTLVKQQSGLIRSLQEALVQSKRALDAALPKSSDGVNTRRGPRRDIYEI